MVNQIEWAEFILVVCTETYANRAQGREAPDRGRGARWEGAIITQQLYDGVGADFIPVVFDSGDVASIPVWLKGPTYYDVSTEDGYDRCIAV